MGSTGLVIGCITVRNKKKSQNDCLISKLVDSSTTHQNREYSKRSRFSEDNDNIRFRHTEFEVCVECLNGSWLAGRNMSLEFRKEV